jgi:FixJ family two-component response regulator
MSSLGYTITHWSKPPIFSNLVASRRPAVRIVDVNMPGMTGVELFAELKKMGLSIATILITAYPDDECALVPSSDRGP